MPLNNNHQLGDAGHISDHDTIANFVNSKGQPNGVAPLDATGAVPSAQLANGVQSVDGNHGAVVLSGTYAAKGTTNTFTAYNAFSAASAGQDTQTTGVAADFSGAVGDSTPNGGYYNRVSRAVTFNGGTNGVRGDAVSSTAANGSGATFFAADFIGVESGGGFVGKGSAQGYYFRGILGAHASGAYGEFGGFLSDMTNNRPGGLAEAAELTLRANVQGKNAAATVQIIDNIGVVGLAAYNWSRGLWVNSGGTNVAGDALYVSGAGGWTNFANFLDTAGAQRFRIDATGKLFIGTGARTLYDDGSNLKTDNTIIAANIFTVGDVYGNDLLWQADSTRKIVWGTGAPAVAANIGSLYLRIDGGAATTLYVKESGTGTTGWVAK